MKNKKWRLDEAIAFYQSQGAPHDKQALIELLTEVQKEKGGEIPKKALHKIANAYDVKKSFLRVIIQQVPTLQLEEPPHKLRICGKKACGKNGGRELAEFVMQTYDVEDGGFSDIGDFSFKLVGCLDKCRKGPVIKWDGVIYTHATPEMIRDLVDGKMIAKE